MHDSILKKIILVISFLKQMCFDHVIIDVQSIYFFMNDQLNNFYNINVLNNYHEPIAIRCKGTTWL